MAKPKNAVVETTAKPKRSLFEISKDFSELEYLLDSIDEDLSDADKNMVNDFLKGLEEDRDKKIDAIVAVIRNFDSRATVRKTEADRIAKLAKYDVNKSKRLKWMILNFLQTHNVKKIETDFNVVLRSENGVAPVILDKYFEENPNELEERFRLVSFKPNLKEIAQALKDGEKLEFAKFGEKGENLKIS